MELSCTRKSLFYEKFNEEQGTFQRISSQSNCIKIDFLSLHSV